MLIPHNKTPEFYGEADTYNPSAVEVEKIIRGHHEEHSQSETKPMDRAIIPGQPKGLRKSEGQDTEVFEAKPSLTQASKPIPEPTMPTQALTNQPDTEEVDDAQLDAERVKGITPADAVAIEGTADGARNDGESDGMAA